MYVCNLCNLNEVRFFAFVIKGKDPFPVLTKLGTDAVFLVFFHILSNQKKTMYKMQSCTQKWKAVALNGEAFLDI